MAPVLLDHRSLLRAGLAMSMILLLVFISGYTVGYSRAVSAPDAELNKTVALVLPGLAYADAAEFEQQIPEATEPGADIDVDAPDLAVDAVSDGPKLSVEDRAVELNRTADNQAVAEEKIQPEDIVATSESAATAGNVHVQLASLIVTPDVVVPELHAQSIDSIVTGPSTPEQSNEDPKAQPQIVDTATRDDARYTIQVGMFTELNYAVSRKQELESQQLSAYIHEYKNKKDEIRFSVRFGYFDSKSSARAALASFEQGMNGSGFITNMSHSPIMSRSQSVTSDQPSL